MTRFPIQSFPSPLTPDCFFPLETNPFRSPRLCPSSMLIAEIRASLELEEGGISLGIQAKGTYSRERNQLAAMQRFPTCTKIPIVPRFLLARSFLAGDSVPSHHTPHTLRCVYYVFGPRARESLEHFMSLEQEIKFTT